MENRESKTIDFADNFRLRIDKGLYQGLSQQIPIEYEAKITFIMNILNSLEHEIDILSDEKSKNVYLSLLSLRCYESQFVFLPYILLQEHNQYFYRYIMKLSDDEIFVDAGTGFGDTVFHFLEATNGKYKHIYAFEPNKENYNLLLTKTNGLKNTTVYNKGLYNSNGIVRFNNSHVLGSSIDEIGSEEIETVRGDNCDIRPTFIKMDVEGAELKALQGFECTIKKFKPKLAICIYHKLEDFWEIPLYIKELVPEYRLYVRHHFYFNNESVLYATI